MVEQFFQLQQHGTTVRREILAGITTFLTMAYILPVQPAMLSQDFAGNPMGLPADAVLLATCLAAAGATLIMGLYARYPIALAPGMGQNAFFVSVIMTLTAAGRANGWQTALGIVFVSGLAFVALSLVENRAKPLVPVRAGPVAGSAFSRSVVGRIGRLAIRQRDSQAALPGVCLAEDLWKIKTGRS